MRRFTQLLLFILGFGSAAVFAEENVSDAVGKWKIRIDGGGEIYSAILSVEQTAKSLSGTYETNGRRARLKEVNFSKKTLSVVVNTQRFSTPVVATFTADLEGDKLSGEVDFDSGTRSRSYDFVASRIGSRKSKVANEAPDRDTKPTTATEETQPANRKAGGLKKVSFRNGVNGYKHALDAEIWAIAPSKSLLKQGTMTTDGNNGGGESQVLLRFEKIFGDSKKQIPKGARIQSAQLTVVAFDPGTTCYLHRLLVPWNSSVTWDGMANGITVDNTEASTVRDGFTFAEINMDKQLVHFDVTPTVQLWADGVENFGWVFVNTGGNGWDFYSSDWLESEFRPMLEVSYTMDRTIKPTAKTKLTKNGKTNPQTSSTEAAQ